uniref:Glycosyl transferase 64 domain-containing protein n=1 Tax=Ananas comosus var. bracteatus TaxID=296719 RepID=A0A6V7PB24_ANACO|nr:unnamed protein product [Ananas comosus var. bracteatus]
MFATPEALLRSPAMAPGVALHHSADRSLNARFLPRGAIRTPAVAVCDDDVALPARALSFALALFRSRSRSRSAPPRAAPPPPRRPARVHRPVGRLLLLLLDLWQLGKRRGGGAPLMV